MIRAALLAVSASSLLAIACGSTTDDGDDANLTSTGGSTTTTGGATGTGGTAVSGGAQGTGGVVATGGVVGSTGGAASGGAATGGDTGSGGTNPDSLLGTGEQMGTGNSTERYYTAMVSRDDTPYVLITNGWGPGFQSQTTSWNGTSSEDRLALGTERQHRR